MEGYCDTKRKNVFQVPCPSEDLGILNIEEFSETGKFFSCFEIKRKCALIQIDEKNIQFITYVKTPMKTNTNKRILSL